ERWNFLHPAAPPRKSYLGKVLEGEEGVFVAATDYLRSVPEMVSRWVPGGLYALGTDGFGRSDTRAALRRHFEVDAGGIAATALHTVSRAGKLKAAAVQEAIQKLGIDPEKIDPMRA